MWIKNEKITLLSASLFILLVPVGAVVDSIRCNIANDLAAKSYDRVRNAIIADNEPAATMYSRSSWDIELQSHNCPDIKRFANVLSSIDYTKKDAVDLNLGDYLRDSAFSPVCQNSPCPGWERQYGGRSRSSRSAGPQALPNSPQLIN